MATIDHAPYSQTVPAQVTDHLLDTVVGAFSRVAARLFAYVQSERTRARLEALSDRDLKDIGLFRADIPAVSRGMFDEHRV